MKSERAAGKPVGRAGFRADVHGLRAIAVLLVLIYHAGLPVTGGFVGVDVFFVISGFLITSHLSNELGRSSKIAFGQFYARRARRILPAALSVAGATMLLSLAILPAELVKSTVQDAIATVFYVPNILFAFRGTDYLAETAPSPFQHYWSLGIEEQFYLLWPLLLLLVWKVLRSDRSRITTLAVVVAGSFAVSLVLVEVSGPWAFFSLPSRAWELGAGALVALSYARLSTMTSKNVAAGLSWLGLALILLSSIFFDESTPFPGIAALAPVAGAALIMAFGEAGHDAGVLRLLRFRAFQFLGTISYSLYLVHWPIVVFVPYLTWISAEFVPVSTLVGCLVAVPLAWAVYRGVEQPFLRSAHRQGGSPKRTFFLAAVASVSVTIIAGLSLVVVGLRPTDAGREAPPISAAVLNPNFTSYVPSNLDPSLSEASESIPVTYADGCHLSAAETLPLDCVFGDLSSPTTIAIYGDSHAAQWFPALELGATENGVLLQSFTKSSCPSIEVNILLQNARYSACETWRDAVVTQINGLKPEMVVISNLSRYTGLNGEPVTSEAWSDGYNKLRARIDPDISIVVLADTPHFDATPALCLDQNLNSAGDCSVARAEAIDASAAAVDDAAASEIGAKYIDLSDYFCDEQMCGPIIGATLVYRDSHHISTEYSRFLSEVLWSSLYE